MCYSFVDEKEEESYKGTKTGNLLVSLKAIKELTSFLTIADELQLKDPEQFSLPLFSKMLWDIVPFEKVPKLYDFMQRYKTILASYVYNI